MSLPSSFLDDLKSRLALVDVIGKSVKLTRRGRQFLGLCPFHGERTPSFHVYDDHFHCFGCGAHGSLIDFVMQRDKVGFREAVERLAAVAGVRLPSDTPEAAERDRRRQSLHDVLEAATVYYQSMLRMPEGAAALTYLRRRGVGDEAIARFRLGYAPAGRFAVKAALGRDGFTDEAMIEAGLVIRPEEPAAAGYDRFRDRVTFPIAERRGRIVGFGGRLLGPGEPKYLNTPETPLFHKGSLLYNLDRATQPARERGTVIVVEGYMDVIGLAEAGWDNVAAPLGTALTEEQIEVLWQVVPEPILLFDADAAGERAAMRAAERALPLLRPGFSLRFANLMAAPGDDPDVVARRYPKQLLHRAFVEAAPLSEFLVIAEARHRRLNNAEHFAALEQRLAEYAQRIADPVARGQFQKVFRERVRRAATRGPANARNGPHVARCASAGPGRGTAARWAARAGLASSPVSAAAGGDDSLAHSAERTLLAILLNHPDFFHEVEDSIGAVAFADPGLDRLRQAIIQALSGAETLDAAGLARLLTAAGEAGSAASVLDDPLIRSSHRLIAPAASIEQVRDTWAENVAAARRLAAAKADPSQPQPPSSKAKAPGALAQRAAHGRASFDDGTD